MVTLLLLLSLFPLISNNPVSANPGKLEWSIVDTPSEEDYVVLSPSEINAIAIGSDDETFYTIDIPNGKVYKSIDAGITWKDDLTEALSDEGATLPAWDIAVAPDNPELVAVVTNARQEVYVSGDGGDSWMDTDISEAAGWGASLLIADITFSPKYTKDGNSRWDIAIGTRKPDGSTNGDVWVRRLLVDEGRIAFVEGWDAQELNMDVTSVCFSPNYSTDNNTILAVASDVDDTYLCTGTRNINTNTTDWNVTTPSVVEISEAPEDSPSQSQIIFSDLALPSNYSGKAASSRTVYASYSAENTTADDVYLIDDNDAFRMNVKGDEGVPIASIAYNNGKLLAGGMTNIAGTANALIRICANPVVCPLKPKWESPSKPPTGGAVSGYANAQVAWSSNGEMAYCGTSSSNVASASDWADTDVSSGHPWSGTRLDESAFSRSDDDGDTWNQLSLIDTEMEYLRDSALSVDTEGTKTLYYLYLASTGSGFDSIWRSESKTLDEETLENLDWERILCLNSKTDDIILRPSAKKDELRLFLAVRGTDDVRYFDKDTQGKWQWERFWDCPDVTDLAVVNDEMFYVLDDNEVNKCSWNEELWGGIWEWQRDIDTGLRHGYTIAASGKNSVFVGESENGESRIAYSTNGGATFKLTKAVPEPGNIWGTPDEEFASNRFIYVASEGYGIYRWAIGRSTSWENLNLGCCLSCYGLAQKGGALYGLCRFGISRTLIPHEEIVTPSDWDSLTVGLPEPPKNPVAFKPGSLKALKVIGKDIIALRAIDDNEYFSGTLDPDASGYDPNVGRLWIYSDIFVLRAPWPTSPALGKLLPCDHCTCQAEVFCFHWRRLPLAEKYDLWIALDEEFTAILIKVGNMTPDDLYSPAWCPPTGSPRLTCGKTYYWKVRSCQSTEDERVHSRWSPPMHFTVKTCSSVEEMHLAPLLKAPQKGGKNVSRSPGFSWIGFPDTTKYEFVLANDAALTQIVVKEEVSTSAYHYSDRLDWGATYFWQVKAIEPVPSEPATGTFTVKPEPAALPALPAAPGTPLWIWLVIGTLSLLIIVVIVLCFVKR